MTYLTKSAIIIVCMLFVVACGPKENTVNLKKSGTEYKIDDNVSFYYPSDFEIDISNTKDTKIDFKKDSEVIFYAANKDNSDNEVDDRDELYTGELEEKGATNIVVSKPIINSGLTSYEIEGEIKETGIKFKHLVYFSSGYTYIYGYIAPKTVYDEKIEAITDYLQSIVINNPSVN